MLAKIIVATLIGLALHSSLAAQPHSVPFSLDPSGAISIPVSVNGASPVRFLLDTGSNRSTISTHLASRLNAQYIAKTSVRTATGVELRPVARLDIVTIGSAVMNGLLVSVAPSTHLEAIAPQIEGIIGQDFLAGHNYTLDYRKRRLTWDGASRAVERRCLAMLEREGRYLLQLPAIGKSERTVLLVPDTGASGLVLYERGGRTPLPLEPGLGLARLQSMSGSRDVKSMMLRELNVGNSTLRNVPAVVVAREYDPAEADGLLPMHLFSRVTFDARERCLIIEQ